MTKLEKLESICQRHDLVIYQDYSGRGMYGKECIGVEGEWYDLEYATGSLRWLMGDERKDSMGLGGIYYWPNTTFEDCENEEV